MVKPLAVFMQFLAPKSIKDRRVLFIEGQNDGKVLVRKGGNLMKHVKLTIDPHGSAARRESNRKSPVSAGIATVATVRRSR